MQVLIIDDNTTYWEIVAPSFRRNDIILHICEHADAIAKLAENNDFAWVIIHESSANGHSIVPKLKRHLKEFTRRYPCIIVNNKSQNLRKEQSRWEVVDGLLDIRSVLPLPLSPEKFGTLQPSFDTSLAKALELIPLPSRLLSLDKQILATNTEWSWSPDSPSTLKRPNPSFEFVIEREAGQSEFWALQEMLQDADDRILQVAYPLNAQLLTSRSKTVETALKFSVERFWSLMQQLGGKRMRVYLKRNSPGTDGTLSLFNVFGQPQPTYDDFKRQSGLQSARSWRSDTGFVSTVIDGEIIENLKNLEEDAISKGRKFNLSYKVFRSSNASLARSSAIRLIHSTLEISSECEAVYIPVVVSAELGLRALFVVDQGNHPISDDFKIVLERRRHSVLIALEEVKRSLEFMHSSERQSIWRSVWTFMREKLPHELSENSFKIFVEDVLQYALKLTGFSLASIAWRRFEGTIPSVLAVEIDETKYSFAELASRKDLVGKKCHLGELPALEEAIDKKENSYYFDGIPGADPKVGNGENARFAIPIEVAGIVKGAIGLSVPRTRHRFTQSDVDKAKIIVDLVGPVLFYFDTVLVNRVWRDTIHHEVRSNLGPAIRYLKKVPKSESQEISLWFIQDLLDSLSNLSPDKGNSEIFDPITMLREEIDGCRVIAEANFNRHIDVSVLGGSALVYLPQGVWRFAVRTLISNALRRGSRDFLVKKKIQCQVIIDTKHISVKMVNDAPNLSIEDVESAFIRGAVRVGDRQSDGSHTALAVTKHLIDEHGGRVTFDRLGLGESAKAVVEVRVPLHEGSS